MAAKQYADACPKFAESERLDPAPGTLLNLATCYERNGQIASAWVTFKEAAAAARKADQTERARLARDKVAELEPKLPLLTIVVPAAADRPDLEIRRDGAIVGRPEWGAAIPVDPGTHVVEAAAPGRTPWQGTTNVGGANLKQSLEVPALEPAPAPPAVALPSTAPTPTPTPAPTLPPAPGDASSGAAMRTAAYVAGGLGVAGLAVGTIAGLLALGDHDTMSHECIASGSSLVCSARGFDASRDAQRAATASTIGFVAGAVLLAGATTLFLVAPSSRRATAAWALAPAVGPRGGGVTLEGSW